MKSYKPKELLKIFKKLGFYIHHQKGSHMILKSADGTRRVTIPIHNKDLKIKTLLAILKDAGIDKNLRN
jgi:predicted RNA binding protein YcfA (HicA-like mRNA interferase family)